MKYKFLTTLLFQEYFASFGYYVVQCISGICSSYTTETLCSSNKNSSTYLLVLLNIFLWHFHCLVSLFILWMCYISLAIPAFRIPWPGYYNLPFLFLFAEASPSPIPISPIFIYFTLWELSNAGLSCDLLTLIHIPGQGDGPNLMTLLPLSLHISHY